MRNDFYVGMYEDQYLAHFGIDGMKWGVQNGPPYPLDRQTHNKVVKKADNTLSSGKKGFYDKRKADKAADEWHRKGKYTYEYTTLGTFGNKFHVEPIKDAKLAKQILKDSAYAEQTRKIKEFRGGNVDGYTEERRAHTKAKKYGLDQGDNWKVFRDAERGDERAIQAVNEWTKNPKKYRT